MAAILTSISASRDEQRRVMPGDAIVPDPWFTVTHAITVEAPPERVWPWLAQMGALRGGWYSYDRIDNGGQPSARYVIDAFQRLAPGDVLPALPGATDAFVVAKVDPPRDLVLIVPGEHGPITSWEHLVEPLGTARSRVIVRGRVARGWKDMARTAHTAGQRPALIEYVYRVIARLPDGWLIPVARLGHRWFEARHMRGIKHRAEASSSAPLLRKRGRERNGVASVTQTTRSHGFVAAGFEAVRAAFERNFSDRGEIGAAVAAYWQGEKVVDLWGGRRRPDSDVPWKEDTMVVVMSTTKGLAAMTLTLANARGWLDYDAPVASYWPEFAQNGKASVTVRQLLGHEAGLVLLDEQLTHEKLRDLDYMARLLARQKPAWPPGTRHGYHTLTLGLYMQELIRRVDPAHRSLGRFFHDELAAPLGLAFYIGLPREIPDERLARVRPLSPWRGLLALRYTPAAVTLKMIAPGSLLRRSFMGLAADPNDRAYLEVEVPAGNGVGTARAIARAYSCFAEGGAELGITPETFARITAPPVMAGDRDEVLGVPSYFSLGFLRPGPTVWFGSSPRAFGAPGAGGSFGFADPDARLGYAYVMNQLDFYLENDPREKALRDAVYRAIARLGVPPRTVETVGVPIS